jgi:hypothetical protein
MLAAAAEDRISLSQMLFNELRPAIAPGSAKTIAGTDGRPVRACSAAGRGCGET